MSLCPFHFVCSFHVHVYNHFLIRNPKYTPLPPSRTPNYIPCCRLDISAWTFHVQNGHLHPPLITANFPSIFFAFWQTDYHQHNCLNCDSGSHGHSLSPWLSKFYIDSTCFYMDIFCSLSTLIVTIVSFLPVPQQPCGWSPVLSS